MTRTPRTYKVERPGQRRYAYRTVSGWACAVYDVWEAKIGEVSSLRWRRYYYGPDAESRARSAADAGE